MADLQANFELEEQPTINAVFSIDVESREHNDLIDRDAPDAHPISAITDLQESLNGKQDVIPDLDDIRSGAALGYTSVQSITSGNANGTISVDGSDVEVAGLGSAAFTESSAYDVAGAASTAEQNAKNYADSLSVNYATAEQGEKADTSVQSVTTGTENGTISVDGTDVAVNGLGSAAYTSSSYYDVAGSASTAEVNAKNYADGLASNYATATQGLLADSALQPGDVINDVVSEDIDKPLSANMGKSLQDQVDNLKARGRFLALWNCAIGLAQSNPPTGTYTYQSGDYFIVGTVATGGASNYRPDGATYTTGVASTVVETAAVSVDDVYYYDGTSWHLQINTQKEVAFVNVAGDPYNNTNLAAALNNKVSTTTTVNNKALSSNISLTASDVGAVAANASITGATKCKITYDSKGLVTAGADLSSSDITTALGYTPYNSSNPNGYTSNVGTVTSVNNVSPVSGNVTLSIPTDTNDLTNGAGYITSSALSGYLTTSDIVSSVSSSSDNTKAVGAKLFYDTCGDIETLINAL